MAPLLIGAALGGVAMYLFDPDRGKRRRALLRDQVVKASHQACEVTVAGARHLAHRSSGAIERAKAATREPVGGDEVLVERVRSKMGRHVTHPGAIEVAADHGHVELSGSVLASEHAELIAAVRKVPGVTSVADRLTAYVSADGVPQLQGGDRRRRRRTGRLIRNWSPSTKLVTGTAAATLALLALQHAGTHRPRGWERLQRWHHAQ